jgi:anti-sigma regulatory factor (Ser/Thr protein kinase)
MSARAERVPFVTLEVPATAERVPQVRRAVVAFAGVHGADDALAGRIALAVTEAVADVVVHAYDPETTDGPVHVVADIADGALEVVVAGVVADVADVGDDRVELWLKFFLPAGAA